MKAAVPWLEAARTVFAPRRAKAVAGLTFIVTFAVYLLLLPATFTGGHPGMAALASLTPGLVVWAFVLAAILTLLVPTTLHVLGSGRGARNLGGAATGGFLGLALSLATPLLCCTSVLPVAFATLAAWLPFFAGDAGGAFQGFLATHEGLFFAVSSLLLLGALAWNLRAVATGTCCEV